MNSERWQRVKQLLDEALAVECSERTALLDRACAGDKELRREVESLLASHEQAGTNFLKNPAVHLKATVPTPKPLLERRGVGVYRIIEEIGTGGMGEVYRAVRDDGQYTKEVAVKLVRSGFDSQDVLRRFLKERQILASLDHPKIARLLDGGTTEDGVPYLVMELIDGKPIDTYCDEQKLNINERLGLFRQVCDAVQYAHQRLVIHRDIKPSNVLVTKEGVPKLLDFGIAKIVEASDQSQATLTQAMTPEYASPEQIRCETITTASDVYSLGVVLYQLLTGCSPYAVQTRTPHVLAQAVCEIEPGRPSTVTAKTDSSYRDTSQRATDRKESSPAKLRRRLVGDLDDITMMALRKEPSRRYGSVEQFAEDIRRHLEGLPVVARKGSWNYRAGKFIQRHRLSMTAAALVVAVVLAGVGATVREARVAQANANRAQKRFDDVRKLANSLLFEINDSIQDLPGAVPARKLLVDRALQYLDSLAQESGPDASLQRELAMAYKRVGDVQGYPFLANLGDTKGALKSYQKAWAIEDPLLKANPENLDDGLNLAVIERRLCELDSMDQNIANAVPECKRAVEVGKRLAAKYPQNTKVQVDLAKDYQTLAGIEGGNLSANMGDTLGALTLHEKAVAIAEKAVAAEPDDPVLQRFFAGATARFGDQLAQTGKLSAAEEQYVRGLKVLQALASPNNATSQHDLGEAYLSLGAIQLARDETVTGEVSFQKALEILKTLAQADPQNVHVRTSLLLAFINLGDAQAVLGKSREATSDFEQAQMIGDHLAVANPTAEVRTYQAVRLVTQGEAEARIGQSGAALRDYRAALDLYKKLSADDPANTDSRLGLAATYDKVGESLVQQGEADQAGEAFGTALRLTTTARQDHANAQVLYIVADSNAGLGDAMRLRASNKSEPPTSRRKHWLDAESFYKESLRAWSEVAEPGLVSFDGFRSTPPSIVNRRIDICKHALR